jgi:hypothetical protein
MALIDLIYLASKACDLPTPFTTFDLKERVNVNDITKDDGVTPYAKSSINAILSNSALKKQPTTNLNKKVLESARKEDGVHVYWFEDLRIKITI